MNEKWVFRLFFMGMLLLAGMHVYLGYNLFEEHWHYGSWALSDLMINYEGGFVRRGLCGDLLLRLYHWNPYPIRTAVFGILCASALGLIALLVHVFRREGWSVMIMAAPFFLTTLLLYCGYALWCRRDALSLICVYGIFSSYKHYIELEGWLSLLALLCLMGLCVIAMLMYEPIYFLAIPMLFVFHFMRVYTRTSSLLQSFAFSFLLVLPASLAMLLVCIHCGNHEVADAIWQSWKPSMERYPIGTDVPEMGISLQALTWDAWQTFQMHFHWNWLRPFVGRLPSAPFTLFFLAAVYYLTTRINTVDLKLNRLRPAESVQISNFLLVQFVCMLPLFTVLSCDMGRIVPCWVISALFACHVLKRLELPVVGSMSSWIQLKFEQSALLQNPYVYIALMLLMPVSAVGAIQLQNAYEMHLIECTLIQIAIEKVFG